MSVNFCLPISILFLSDPRNILQNPYFYAEVSALYAKIPSFYADLFLFGFQYPGNVQGQVPVGCLRYLFNDSA